MGLRIGTENSNTKTITFKNSDGTVAGTMSVTTPGKKKTKRLRYNFKEISVQIMGAKTSGNARKAAAKARSRASMLRQQLKNDDYDSRELKSAITHALKMEQVARKRAKHLQQEEKIQRQGGGLFADTNEIQDKSILGQDISETKELKAREEELKKLMQDYEKLMEESIKESMEEITESISPEDMSPEDFEMLKKKHRSKELKEIMEADLQYLKAMFERLAKEKQETGTGSIGADYGVSVELVGVEMPVQTAEIPAITEGGSVDIMI